MFLLLNAWLKFHVDKLLKEAVTLEPVPPPPPPLPVFTVIGNVLPSPLVNVIVFNDTDAVTNSEPVFVLPPPPFKA